MTYSRVRHACVTAIAFAAVAVSPGIGRRAPRGRLRDGGDGGTDRRMARRLGARGRRCVHAAAPAASGVTQLALASNTATPAPVAAPGASPAASSRSGTNRS